MSTLFLTVFFAGSGVLLYLYRRDQREERERETNSFRRVCRIENLEERCYLNGLSADPDDNDTAYFDELPVSVSDTVLVYQTDEADSPNNSGAAAQDEELYDNGGTDDGTDYADLFNPAGYVLAENADNTEENSVETQSEPQVSVTLTSTIPAPVYAHNLLNDGTSRVTSAGNYYELTAERAGADTLNALKSATNLTIAATFNVDSVNGWHYIATYDCPNNTGAEVFLRIRDGKLQFGYWDSYQNHLTETDVSANTLYSVAGTFDGTTWKLYVNGEEAGTPISYTPPNGITNLDVRGNGISSSWFVGRHGTPTDLRTFGGNLYLVAMWDTALSAADINGWAVSIEGTSSYSETEGLDAYWGNTEIIAAASFADGIFQFTCSQIVSDSFSIIDNIQEETEDASCSFVASASGTLTTVTTLEFSYNAATTEWTLSYAVSAFDVFNYASEGIRTDSITGNSVLSSCLVSFTADLSVTLLAAGTVNNGTASLTVEPGSDNIVLSVETDGTPITAPANSENTPINGMSALVSTPSPLLAQAAAAAENPNSNPTLWQKVTETIGKWAEFVYTVLSYPLSPPCISESVGGVQAVTEIINSGLYENALRREMEAWGNYDTNCEEYLRAKERYERFIKLKRIK